MTSRDSLATMADDHSSSLVSSSSSSAGFFAGFFFFFLFLLFAPVDLAVGCSRIFKISSSVIFLSVLYFDSSGAGGAAKRTSPFLVMAILIHQSEAANSVQYESTHQLLSGLWQQVRNPCPQQLRIAGGHSNEHIPLRPPSQLSHRQAASS